MTSLPISARRTGFRCASPVHFEANGEVYQRPCGRCQRCWAGKKSALTARCVGEALESDSVFLVTLTYAPKWGPHLGKPWDCSGGQHWDVSHRQKFLRAVRDRLKEEARQHVGAPVRWQRKSAPDGVLWKDKIGVATRRMRYFGAGEIGGNGTKRNHWHLILFLSGGVTVKDTLLRHSPQRPGHSDRNEMIKQWPHGWAQIDMLPMNADALSKAVRYVASYLDKAALPVRKRGDLPRLRRKLHGPDRHPALMFRSLKPALGTACIVDWAERQAQNNLPLSGTYRVQGVRRSRGNGDYFDNHILGVSRKDAISAYRAAFVAKYGPERDMPDSAFRRKYDPEYISPAMVRLLGRDRARARVKVRLDVGAKVSLPPKVTGLRGLLQVRVGRDVAGMVRMTDDGSAVWLPEGGKPLLIPETGAAGVLPQEAVGLVDEWIARCRPDGWLSARQRFESAEDRRIARVKALVAGFPRDVFTPGATGFRIVPLTGVAMALRRAEISDGVMTGLDGRAVRKWGRVVYRKMSVLAADGTPNRRTYRPPDPALLIERDDYVARPVERRQIVMTPPQGANSIFWEGMPPWLRKTA